MIHHLAGQGQLLSWDFHRQSQSVTVVSQQYLSDLKKTDPSLQYPYLKPDAQLFGCYFEVTKPTAQENTMDSKAVSTRILGKGNRGVREAGEINIMNQTGCPEDFSKVLY